MYVFREIVKNQLLAVPFVRQLAKARHRTGINEKPSRVQEIYRKFFERESPCGNSILELGPGQTHGILKAAKQNGARRAVMLDIEPYLDPAMVQRCGIEYELYDGRRMPFADNSFDIVCSHTVLEHVRYPQTTIREIARVLKPGGHSVHMIDLRDHLYFQTDNPNLFHCMQYSERVWNAMAWNRSTYVNRLRYSDWIDQFEKNGIRQKHVICQQSPCIGRLHKAGKIPHLKHFNTIDATTTFVTHYGQKDVARIGAGCQVTLPLDDPVSDPAVGLACS